ncbi:MAG: response regulator [Cyanobacteria bacterium P01_E01_bin.6]
MEDRVEILLVDDIPANLGVLTEILSAAGYRIATATSGKRALKLLNSYVPSLILLDICMPGIDGFETYRQIKNIPENCSTPIIFISALSDTDYITHGLSLGAVDYIGKPFHKAELLARVKNHLQLHLLTQNLEEQVDKRTAELQTTLKQLEQSKLQLIRSEKMSAIGSLVSGVAHEINNPIGFIDMSIDNISDCLKDLYSLVNNPPTHPENQIDLESQKPESVRFKLIKDDLCSMLSSMKRATKHIQSVSRSLRIFSRQDTSQKVEADLHDGLDSTLLILKYRLAMNKHHPAVQVVKHYGELPFVHCFPDQLNQVFINILANAIEAFDEDAQKTSDSDVASQPQTITIHTRLKLAQNIVEICIHDNGHGMTEQVKAQIFTSLFTTKDKEKGTGLGLAIAHQIVTETHGGSIDVTSELGQGTEFCIQLPISS